MRRVNTSDLIESILTPVWFLTVALTGGLRIQIETGALQFMPPKLISCIVGALAMILLVRCGIVMTPANAGERIGAIASTSAMVRVAAIYVATVQVFNLVTPERGLLSVVFNLFYLLILLNDLFVVFNPRRLAGVMATILGGSFLLKYLLLPDLFAPAESWSKYVLQELMKAGSLGALDQELFAPATGYLAFFTVAVYVLGLYLIAPRVNPNDALLYRLLSGRYRLSDFERAHMLRAALASDLTMEPPNPDSAHWAAVTRPGPGGELRE